MTLPLTQLGTTRTVVKPNYAFIAPDGHVANPIPGWRNTDGITLMSPRMGAQFHQFLARMGQNSESGEPLAGVERFVYVVEGKVELVSSGQSANLQVDDFAYLPANTAHGLRSKQGAVLNVYEKLYQPHADDSPPEMHMGRAQDVTGEDFLGNPNLQVRKLLPDSLSFDMAVNTMTFAPGTPLPFVETHVMEHGLLMLRGSGIYKLEQDWYPITQGDVLWMGPYCPQWFAAIGEEEACYLLYKDVHRDPLAGGA
ncbi:MAG: (S)-ureidoglycine aminohydrolase [Deinococcota bacterium]